ncbi:zinc finger protein 513-like [Astyanax mexicanus]|uniref:Zinc finger protein 513 n=1 Tax=Astyanax mexicanus TaxID=7994 RepID=A0A8T2MHA4_ASTMX|nr:zinc finger protein 513-like [Astyanax mexicanus]
MPRRKQQNPQPVKLDSKDGVGINTQASLSFEGDFLLGQDLDFSDPDNDNKIIGLDKFSADLSLPSFQLGDEESSSFSRLSMESDTDDLRPGDSEREEGASEPTFPPYLSCRGCTQLLDEPLGPGMDLVGPYCLRCCKGNMGSVVDRAQRLLCSGSQAPGTGAGQPGGEDSALKLHSCMLCGFSSRYTNHVKRHMKVHNGEKPYRCPLCSYASAQLVNLQRHLRIHTGEKPYKCEHCTFACSSLGNLKRHQRMHMVTNSVQNIQRPVSGQSLRCPPVGQKPREDASSASRDGAVRSDAVRSEAVRSEANINSGGDSRYVHAFAALKPEQQSSSRALEPGQARTQPAALPPLLFPFTCRLCGLALDDEDGSSAQICAKCTLEMLTKDTAGGAGERGDKVYTCAACPFLTHYPNHLARHMKTHSGEKPYKCPQCDYASAHFDNLKRHHRVHTGEKPYKCHLCDYACGNLANLKRHQRVHSGAKPFQCAICNYSCNQSMNLKRHMLRHTGEKPHKCQECGYTTGHWDNYKRHQKKHGLATDGWVKVPLPENEEEAEDDEDV